MKNFLQYRYHSSNSFFYHNVKSFFERIEATFFILLCLILIGTSKIDSKINQNISMLVANVAIPVSSAASMPFNAIINLATNFKELIDAKEQNSKLLDENNRLKSFYINSLNIAQENQQLRDILAFVRPRSSRFIAADLVSQPNYSYSNNAVILAGENTGIKENDIVVGKNSMIGRVLQVGERKSRILLVSDINSRIPVIISNSGIKGILAGDNGGLMEILYLEKEHPVQIGDLVFTSGDGDAIPPGYLVGVVTDVNKYSAFVKMAENVKNLDIVGVVKY